MVAQIFGEGSERQQLQATVNQAEVELAAAERRRDAATSIGDKLLGSWRVVREALHLNDADARLGLLDISYPFPPAVVDDQLTNDASEAPEPLPADFDVAKPAIDR